MQSSKILGILQYVLLGISALLGVLLLFDAISVDTVLYWCYFLAIGGAASAIIFPAIFMAQNPSKAKSTFAGLGLLILIAVIGYFSAGDEILSTYEKFIDDPDTSKYVGTGLITLYILGIGAIAAAVVGEVTKIFK